MLNKYFVRNNRIAKISRSLAGITVAAGLLIAADQMAFAQEATVGACSGASLPKSVVTDIMAPVIGGIVTPVQNTVNPVLTLLDPLTLSLLPAPLSINATTLLSNAAAGDPITLSVLNSDGVIVGPDDKCITSSDAVTLDTPKGVSIGGNMITGLGANGSEADAGEIDSIAIGNEAATDASALGSIAIGTNAAVSAGATGGVALGDGATASQANSVALGAGSTTSATLGAAAFVPDGGTIAGATASGEVSVGNALQQRRITNVAAGAADTDAVNLSQLEAVDDRINDAFSLAVQYDDVTQGSVTLGGAAGTTIAKLKAGAVSALSTDAVNGSQLHGVSQSLADTLGGSATVNADGTVTGPTYQIQGSSYTTVYSAFGAVDGALDGVNTRIDNIDSTVSTLGDRAVTYDGPEGGPKDTVTLDGTSGTTITNVKPGALTAISTDAVNGSQLYATNQAVATLDQNAVKYDVDADGNKTDAVTLVGADPDAPVVIHNLATGVASTDAVNVAQLQAGLTQTLTLANAYSDSLAYEVDNFETYVDNASQTTLNQANAYTDMRFGELQGEIGSVRTEARQAAAIGLAAGSLRFDQTPGKFSMGLSGGFWRGEGAGAFGAGYTSESGRIRANATATTAGGAWGGGAGFTVTLN